MTLTKNHKPMKPIIVFTFLIFNTLSLIAKDTIAYKNKLDISLTSIMLEDGSIPLGGYGFSRLSFNRNLNDFICVGVYSGFGWYEEFLVDRGENYYSYTASEWKFSAQYGINGKLYILPIILKKEISRFDFYMSGDIGLISMFTTPHENISPKRGTYFDYSLLGGASIFLFKKIGLFMELGFRNFKYHQGLNTNFGLRYRF